MKSEFYWGLFSSLIVALMLSTYQVAEIRNSLPGLQKYKIDSGALGFSLFPFVGIYLIVGVIGLFIKKSEKFSKGLLLSTVILFLIMVFCMSGLMRF